MQFCPGTITGVYFLLNRQLSATQGPGPRVTIKPKQTNPENDQVKIVYLGKLIHRRGH